MRIYAVADIHGKPERITAINSRIVEHKPDLLILAGDISSFWNQAPVLNFIRSLDLPCAGILGNSDFGSIGKALQPIPGFTLLGSAPLLFSGVRIFGISGTVPIPFASRICIREKPALARIEKSLSPFDILVVHPPPRGFLDKVGGKYHAGSFNLRKFLDTARPGLVICGHIHEQSGMAVHRRTRIVNCAMTTGTYGALIDTDGNSHMTVRLLTADNSSLSI